MRKAPIFLKKYFWDIDFNKLDVSKSSTYIIERILEMGDEKAIRWVLKTFPKDLVKNVIINSRGLSPQTAGFWSHVFKINDNKILCLQKPYLKVRETHWPY